MTPDQKMRNAHQFLARTWYWLSRPDDVLRITEQAAATIASMTTQTTPSQPDLDEEDDGSQYHKGLDAHDAQTASEAPYSPPAGVGHDDTTPDDCVCVFCRVRRQLASGAPQILAGTPGDLVFERSGDQPANLVRISVCDGGEGATVMATVVVSTEFLLGVVAQRDLIAGVKLEAPKTKPIRVEVTPEDLKAFTRTALGEIFDAALSRIEAEDQPEAGASINLDDPTRPVE